MNEKATAANIYRIEVKGQLHERWAVWLSESVILMENISDNNGVTAIVVGVADQAALRGLMNKLWDLNLHLLAVSGLTAYETARGTGALSARTTDSS